MTRGQATQDTCFLSVLSRSVLTCYNPFRNRGIPNKTQNQMKIAVIKLNRHILNTEPTKAIKIFNPSTVLDYIIETGRSMVHQFYVCLPVLIDVTQAQYITTGSVH